MNQVEFENTIRDLLKLERDAFSNPNKILKIDEYFKPEKKHMPRYVFAVSHFAFPDLQRPELAEVTTPPVDLPAEHGFTNDAKTLQFTPLLFEKYVQLGREIVASPTLPIISRSWESLFIAAWLSTFLPRAFRRKVTEQEVTAFSKVFTEHFAQSNSFTEAMQATVASILVSPDFLFLFQASHPDLSPEQQKSFVNASKLSYFLWATMPDDILLESARQGELVTKAQVLKQARRMMLDKKVKSLATDFGMQWLKVNRLSSSLPDEDKFADFYIRKKQPIGVSMAIEQLLLFEAILVEDRSILDFIHTDFAYLNRDLLFWYGYKPENYVNFNPSNKSPENFYRIFLPKDHPRGGAITSGSTLVLTSTSVRSSPVFRGAWIAEAIFNQPPPPPPPNVPALDDIKADETGKNLNPRQKLAVHRDDPNCSSCHSRIDPLGFGLEQFDAVGKMRNNYDNGDRVDSSGEIGEDKFEHAFGLKRAILEKKEVFIQAFVEHLLRYAVNRKLTFADRDSVDQIVESVLENDARFHSVVESIVVSSVFLGD